MHTVGVNLIADQVININGKVVNVHDIQSIVVNGDGLITNAYVKPDGAEEYEYMKRAEGWLVSEEE